MHFIATEHISTRRDSFNHLKMIINKYKYPLIFENSSYISDAHLMKVECMFGHKMHIKPYRIKSVYNHVKIDRKLMPKCYECQCNGIGNVELKHRVNTYYDSGKEIKVIGKYLGPNIPTRYMIGNKHSIAMTPSKMSKVIGQYPEKYRKFRGLFFEQILLERSKLK